MSSVGARAPPWHPPCVLARHPPAGRPGTRGPLGGTTDGRPPLAHGLRAGRRGVADRARLVPPAALVAADAAGGGRELERVDVGAADRQGARGAGRLPGRAVQGLRAAALVAGAGGDGVRGAVPRGDVRGGAGAGREGHRGRDRDGPAAEGLGAGRRHDAQAGGAQAVRRGAGRARGSGGGRRVSRRECVFWGWGEPGAGPSLPDHAAGFLRSEIGVSGAVISTPVSLEEVRLRPPALGDALRERLAGLAAVRDDPAARVGRCRGKSYLDLLRQRAGDCEDAPDAVVAPPSAEAVQAVLAACAEAGVAVVPFGGGTSVVGGLEPLRGTHDALISLDLGRLEGIESFDERSQLAWLGGGTRLPEADHALEQRGYMLGHTPQSYEWATVGGCVATRSAG